MLCLYLRCIIEGETDTKPNSGTPAGSSDAGADKSGASPPDNKESVALESELAKQKGVLEVEATQLKSRIAQLEGEVATGRTANDAVGDLKTQVESLTSQLTESGKQVEGIQSELANTKQVMLETRKAALTAKHGLKPEELKDMGEVELSALERVLPGVAPASDAAKVLSPNGLDAGGSGGADHSSLNARDKIAQALAQEKKGQS